MKEVEKQVEKLALRTDYKNTKSFLIASQAAFIISVFLLAFSSLFSYLTFHRAAYFLFFGGLVYEIYFIYLLHEAVKGSIKKYKGMTKKVLSFMNKLAYVMVFLTIVVLMLLRRIDVDDNKLAILASLILIVVPTLFWDKIVSFFKRINKKLFLLPLMFLLFLSPVLAQTNMSTIQQIQQTLTTVNTILQFVMEVGNFLSGIINWFIGIGLGSGIAYLVLTIVVLILAYIALKYIRLLLKWIIVGLIVWMILAMIGVV